MIQLTSFSESLRFSIFKNLKRSIPDLVYNYRFHFDRINYCDVEFYSAEQNLFGKIHVRTNRLQCQHKDKLLKDCLKLIAIESAFNRQGKQIKKALVITDAGVKDELQRSWVNYILKDFGIKLMLIELSEEDKRRINVFLEYQKKTYPKKPVKNS